MAKKFTIEEMLKTRFERARRRGNVRNFRFEDEQCSLGLELNPQERCVVKIDSKDSSEYHLTNQRIIHRTETGTKYIDLKSIKCFYCKPETKTGVDRLKSKASEYDTLFIEDNQGNTHELQALGDTWYTLHSFLSWYLNR